MAKPLRKISIRRWRIPLASNRARYQVTNRLRKLKTSYKRGRGISSNLGAVIAAKRAYTASQYRNMMKGDFGGKYLWAPKRPTKYRNYLKSIRLLK